MILHYLCFTIRVHLHQRGAGLPAGPAAGEECFLCGSSVYTSAGPCPVSVCRRPFSRHWVINLYILTNQLFIYLRILQKNRSVSELCGCMQQAHRGGTAGPRRCKQHHTIPSNGSTAEPAGGIRMGVPQVFRVVVNAP